MAYTAEEFMKIVRALMEQGMTEEEASAAVAADIQKQNTSTNEAPPLRDQYGRFDNKAAQEFFSHDNKKELAKDYFDPLDGIESVDNLSKQEWVDLITGRNKETHKPQPMRNVRDAIDFFKSVREGK
ncbi:hypothetical protein GTGU_03584 [Trabulsiella guamensis ATCC 49490]|uniref:Uncharacterized protein n=1 Tax=Trabulsiella guamensis ATCC 49490 TaxID=1005994 RepID=A0A084ZUC2_9ENTR|nr:hypothetical protein [Trabulsiella guamensis]KFC01067.1 hypothetical protein GTGU_03584 [Trabulsiella guamensis ATCC 49490]